MAIKTARINVTAGSPTLLSVGASSDFTPGRSVAVYNPGPDAVLLGGDDVGNTGNTAGFGLQSGQTFTADLRGGDLLYGLMSSGTQQVHVIQVGV